MRNRITIGLVAVALATGGCTSTRTSPATAPPTTERVPTTTTDTTPSTTATTMAATTTIDRVAEIQAIFDDLELRRLEAIRDQNVEAFRSLHANDEYLEQSMMAFETIMVLAPKEFRTLRFEVLGESDSCLAARVRRDYSEVLPNGSTTERTIVLQLTKQEWGISWIGEGWSCDGPHPLDS